MNFPMHIKEESLFRLDRVNKLDKEVLRIHNRPKERVQSRKGETIHCLDGIKKWLKNIIKYEMWHNVTLNYAL